MKRKDRIMYRFLSRFGLEKVANLINEEAFKWLLKGNRKGTDSKVLDWLGSDKHEIQIVISPVVTAKGVVNQDLLKVEMRVSGVVLGKEITLVKHQTEDDLASQMAVAWFGDTLEEPWAYEGNYSREG